MKDVEQHSLKIFKSMDTTDRRLINAYQAKRWRDDYKFNKGKSSAFTEINQDPMIVNDIDLMGDAQVAEAYQQQ